VLLGIAALTAVVAVRRFQRELARGPGAGDRPHRSAPRASAPSRDIAGPARCEDVTTALVAELRSSTTGNPRRDRAIIEILDRFVAGHGGETAQHHFRVGEMARELALMAGLPPEEAELLRRAAPLHDVGQASIPAAILNKPGRFMARESALMKRHATVGHHILSQSSRPIFRAAATIALQHHERWDGMGYPQGLKGEDIHLHGRIVGLVDTLDAMFSRRSYRKALNLEQALGIIRSQRGHHYDPRLVDLLTDNLQVFMDIIVRHADAPPAEGAATSAPPRPRGAPAPEPDSARRRARVPVGAGAGDAASRHGP
jgi:HD-GYP domain-containing protein (c-di-GMP phosphodiesterase class II)